MPRVVNKRPRALSGGVTSFLQCRHDVGFCGLTVFNIFDVLFRNTHRNCYFCGALHVMRYASEFFDFRIAVLAYTNDQGFALRDLRVGQAYK